MTDYRKSQQRKRGYVNKKYKKKTMTNQALVDY